MRWRIAILVSAAIAISYLDRQPLRRFQDGGKMLELPTCDEASNESMPFIRPARGAFFPLVVSIVCGMATIGSLSAEPAWFLSRKKRPGSH